MFSRSWSILSIILGQRDSGRVSWPGFERKILQTGIEVYHAMVKSVHLQTIEHCSRKWIPLRWKYSQPQSFEERVDWKRRQSCSAYTDLEMDQNIQKLVDAICKRENRDMSNCQMKFICIFCYKMCTHVTFATWMIICCLLMLCYQEYLCTTIMIMVNGSHIIGPW